MVADKTITYEKILTFVLDVSVLEQILALLTENIKHRIYVAIRRDFPSLE